MTKTIKNKHTKDFVTEVLKFGLYEYSPVEYKKIIVRYNGGENWNYRYGGDWYDIYIPIEMPQHKILTKKIMQTEDIPLCSEKSLYSTIENVKKVLSNHFKIHAVDFSVGNNKLYLNLSVT